MEYTYRIHRIPTTDPHLLAFLTGKYVALRLSALTLSPGSYSSTFADESVFPFTKWVERLKRPALNTFVAVAYAAGTPAEEQTIDTGDWVGSASLIGPTPKPIYDIPLSGGPPSRPDAEEKKWQTTAVYSSPSHRGRGVANLLMRGVLEYAVAASKVEGKSTRMRIMISPGNELVRTMYLKLGFEDAGATTLAEGYVANGEGELLPADGGSSKPEKYHQRLGLIMVRVVERGKEK